jgi:hypothetical protein
MGMLESELKVQVEERQTRVNVVHVAQVVLQLTAVCSAVTPPIEYLEGLGGTFSPSLLEPSSEGVLVIFPYPYGFQIHGSVQGVVTELRRTQSKAFHYLIYPSRQQFAEEECENLKAIVRQLVLGPTLTAQRVLVLVADFIPYLANPSVITGGVGEGAQYLQTTLLPLQGKLDYLPDSVMFGDSPVADALGEVLPSPRFIVCSVAFTYNFLNDLPALSELLGVISNGV